MTELDTSDLHTDPVAFPPTESIPVAGPDRADAPVSEVTERFLRAVIARVPLDRIEELHLFAPLRQGGTETGIAVVAARVPVTSPDAPVEHVEIPDHHIETDLLIDAAVDGDVDDEDVSIHADTADDSPYLAREEESGDRLDVLASVGVDDEALDDVIANAADVPIVRHTVYTARYRLVLKGPDRGKWEADVVDEADAPLITVETVVRGVQRRAGEETEILRYSDRQIARALRMEWPRPVA